MSRRSRPKQTRKRFAAANAPGSSRYPDAAPNVPTVRGARSRRRDSRNASRPALPRESGSRLPSVGDATARQKRNARTSRGAAVRAGYEAARPNSDVASVFARSFPQTTLAAQTAPTRSSLRTQARQEYLNNPRAAGIARLFGLYVVGTGPRLKFRGWDAYLKRPVDRDLARYVEFRWERFATETRLAALLRSATASIIVDGEAFVALAPNPRRRDGFGAVLIDAQRIGNPNGEPSTRTRQDGVFLDAFGEPVGYCVYDLPEFESSYYDKSSFQLFSADDVFHAFREDLPGQTRGVSWFASILPYLQQLREYTAAVVESAKVSAKVFATVKTQHGYAYDDGLLVPNEYANNPGAPYDNSVLAPYETTNGKFIRLPPGEEMQAFAPAQPTTSADAFVASSAAQIGYALGLPRNKATGSSHEYNFASGRLDNQPFEMLIETLRREQMETTLCDRIFRRFYETLEADVVARFGDAPYPDDADWEWIWPSPPLVDPEAKARADSIRVKSGQATLAEVWRETHPFDDFEDAREIIKRDRADFPEIYGSSSPEPSTAAKDGDASTFSAPDETAPTAAAPETRNGETLIQV